MKEHPHFHAVTFSRDVLSKYSRLRNKQSTYFYLFWIFSMPYGLINRTYTYLSNSFSLIQRPQIFQSLCLFPALRLFRSLEHMSLLLIGTYEFPGMNQKYDEDLLSYLVG